MRLSDYAFEKLKEFEGLRLKAYRCSSGVLTIGYGHTKNVKPGDVIDEATANMLLIKDVEAVERLANLENFAKKLSQGQYDAFISFLFNVKYSSYLTSTLRKKLINNVDDTTIPDEIRRWVYGTDPETKKKIKLPGLVKRREWEAQMYEDL